MTSGDRPPARCRFCSRPLTALQRLGRATCGEAACRHRAALERVEARLAALQTVAAGSASTALPLARLIHHPVRTAPLRASAVRRHRAHLEALAAAPESEIPAPASPAQPPTAAAGLCAVCRGRCCREGAARHAFIDRAVLQRWCAAHPGRGVQDAVEHYMACLPARHVHESCVYNGARGCVLPREERADICNRYACDALQQVQERERGRAAGEAATPAATLAAVLDGARLVRLARIDDGGVHRMPLPGDAESHR
jgi:hypothetical protein